MPTLRPRQTRPSWLLALSTTAALLLALTGCSDTTEIPPADPKPSATPLFATEEEALEAATAVYEEYLAVLDSALADPSFNYEVLDGLAREQAYDAAVSDITSFRQDGLKISGPRTLSSTELQILTSDSQTTEIAMYACEDVSSVTLLNSTGESLSTENRPNRSVFEVVVTGSPADLVVTSRLIWEGQPTC